MEIKFQKNSVDFLKHSINKISRDKKIKKKMMIIKMVIVLIFLIPCIYKVYVDLKYVGEIGTSEYALIFLYFLCGLIWCFLLPSILYKTYSMIKTKQLEMMCGNIDEETTIKVNDDELIEENVSSKIVSKWSEVTDIKYNKRRVLIKINGFYDIYVPADAFKDDEEKKQFIELIKQKAEIKGSENSLEADKEENKFTEENKEQDKDIEKEDK